jgi:cytochrome c biogenesis protein CcmG, thiol:disulfide interchange protein DsbE
MSEPVIDRSQPSAQELDRDADEVVEIGRPRSGVTAKRIAVSLVAILAIVGAIYLLDSSQQSATNAATSINVPGSTGQAPRVGNPAPNFELPNLDGKLVKLSDYRGQPVWINFWASWCPPCRAELPDVEAAYQDKKGQGLVLLAISIGEDAPVVKQYVEKMGMTSTVLVDSTEAVASRYRVNGIPTHLFVDKEGFIRDLVVGGLSKTTIGQRLSAIMR